MCYFYLILMFWINLFIILILNLTITVKKYNTDAISSTVKISVISSITGVLYVITAITFNAKANKKQQEKINVSVFFLPDVIIVSLLNIKT